MAKISCIYKLENIKNGKIYIGQTSNFSKRKYYHKKAIKSKNHENPLINKDLQFYNLEDFQITILEFCEDNKSIRLERETYWINHYGGIESDNLYNFKDTNGFNKDLLTHMSIGRKGIPAWNKGKSNIYAKGKKLSEETKQKMRLNHRDYSGSNNPNYKYTPEFIEILRNEYNVCHNYSELSRKYNINSGTISRLLKFGHA